jgi:hypothetical protein
MRRVVVVLGLVVVCVKLFGSEAEPVIEPVIGTRVEEDGRLTETTEIDTKSTRFIGCDLRHEHVPRDQWIELTWVFTPENQAESPRVIHAARYKAHRPEPLRAWVDRVLDERYENALGSYECVWTLGSRGVSARLVVRRAR